jgi:hypothetical protein
MASGGLTHFVIDEEFDQAGHAGMQTGNEDLLAGLPESYFKVGRRKSRTGIRSLRP